MASDLTISHNLPTAQIMNQTILVLIGFEYHNFKADTAYTVYTPI